MDNYLLYHPRAADKTGPLLGRALEIPYGTHHSGRAKVLIRYGTTAPAGQADRVLNTIEAISHTTDKRGSLEIFLKNGILAPAPSAVPQSLPAIGRKGRHESGCGFWLCLQAADVTHALNNGAEYGVFRAIYPHKK